LHYTPTAIIFPYLEYDCIVYWQARSIVGKRFLFPDETKTGVKKSNFLYGFDDAEPGQPIYIVEAIFCAITIGPGGLASGGALMQDEQRRKIRAINPHYIVLAPDNDKEGKASLLSNWKLLHPYHEMRYVLPPDPHKDWNDFAKETSVKEVRKFISQNQQKLTLKEAIKLKPKKKKFF